MPDSYRDYIPVEKEQKIIGFKYNGKDDSILYNHVTGKLS